MKNNKGLSTIVTMLIIILLALVAVGIIWGVVGNLLDKNKGNIESATKCLDVDIVATKVVNNTLTNYSVTLQRTSTGDTIDGVKLVFYSDVGNTGVLDFDVAPTPLQTITRSVETIIDGDGGLPNANKVAVTPYFLDESGNQKLCPVTKSKEF